MAQNQAQIPSGAFRIKVFVSFAILVVIASLILTLAFYWNFQSQLRQDVKERLHDVIAIAALQIDATAHNTLKEPKDEGSPTYLKLRRDLQKIRDAATDIRYVYTMRRGANNEIVFVLDAETIPEEIAHLGDIYDDASELLAKNFNMLGRPLVEENFYTDKWGTWLTGYAPFYTSDGQRAGVVGIDIAASNILEKERRLLLTLLPALAAVILVILFLAWLIGNWLAGAATTAMNALWESEARFKALSEAGFEAIFISEKGICLNQNLAAEEMFGYTLEEAIGRPGIQWIAEESRDMVKHNMLSGYEGSYEAIAQRKDGSHFPAMIRGKVIDYQNRQVRVTALLDFTERKQQEEELESFFNLSPDIIGSGNFEGCFTKINISFEELLGHTKEDILNKPFLSFVHDSDVEKTKEALSTMQKGESKLSIENRYRCKDGSYKWIEWHVRSLAQERKFFAVGRDVTERKHMQGLMIQTEKMMSVGGLAAGMAHELNNPLGGILQGIQNIQRRLSPDLDKNREVAQDVGLNLASVSAYFEKRGITHFLHGVSESGERAAVIVENMLQFARKSEVTLLPEDLEALIDSTLELAAVDYSLKKQYDFRKIKIVREYDPTVGPVPCIKSEFQQILLNLFRNAAQAFQTMEITREPPRITVRIRANNGMVCVEVEDNGPGMDEAVRGRVFEPFFTTRSVGEGTGLGLSVSYFIVTQEHRGVMTVESQPGLGSKFSICLPLGRL
ncbi:MAG: PAS domain S-box protein [Candidatus Sedimenticola sp. (ex Thyasira tokunagai)]